MRGKAQSTWIFSVDRCLGRTARAARGRLRRRQAIFAKMSKNMPGSVDNRSELGYNSPIIMKELGGMRMRGKLVEECGIFGIAQSPLDGHIQPAVEAYLALFALQHRGQEACGLAVSNNRNLTCVKDLGLVNDVLLPETLERLPGQMAMGHVRYSTTGTNTRENAQPILVHHMKGSLAVAHNGNLVNADKLRGEIERSGGIFQTTSDSEVIAHCIVRERLKTPSIEMAVLNCMGQIKGAYSLVVMSPQKLIAARDPNGFRPLCLGKKNNSWVFASESCALDAIGASFVRDVLPGEMLVVENGMLTTYHCGQSNPSICLFEYVYFARPDSVIDGQSVDLARQEMGRQLAIAHPVDADVVVGVPDSGISAAIGYAKESGIPYGVGLLKNRYIGRTFIQPNQKQRENSVRLKLNPLVNCLKGKRVVLVDDSIVRGTTSAPTVALIREAGATEVHMRISSPPFLFPCYFGTDVPDRDSLIANHHSVETIGKMIGADSLGYLPIESLEKVVPELRRGFCSACFHGKYPIPVEEEPAKERFEPNR